MPQFAPAKIKTATVPMTVKPSGLSCDLELYLVKNGAKAATSGVKPFSSTGVKQSIVLPLTMPSIEGIYPVYLDLHSSGLLIGAYRATEDVDIARPMPSDLLITCQSRLTDAIEICESEDPGRWVMIPDYGLQYACPAIPQLNSLMTEEAIRIGMISSASERYFVRDIMYFSDGTTIVPYWWPCPYCSAQLRSPALREQHKQQVHSDILSTKATILRVDLINPRYYPLDDSEQLVADGLSVTWRNDSPSTITGRAELYADYWRPDTYRGSQDNTIPSGGTATASFRFGINWQVAYRAVLTLVGSPFNGLFLDEETG